MSDSVATVAPLDALLRKAAADAGFDLEPEIDGTWWRLRASGALGIAWIRRASPGIGALLALPLASQLTELNLPGASTELATPLPPSAAGAVIAPTPDAVYAALRRVRVIRAHTPGRLQQRVEAEVAKEFTSAHAALVIPTRTELIAEAKRRVGQDVFRDALLEYWDGCCAVTALPVPTLLRASHVKPWAAATDLERLDVHNGLLLAVHLDALFDAGLLTFDDSGTALLSDALPQAARELFRLDFDLVRLRWVRPEHLTYLAYHREHVFKTL